MKNLVKNVVLIAFFMSFIPVSYAQDDVEEVVVTANKKQQNRTRNTDEHLGNN